MAPLPPYPTCRLAVRRDLGALGGDGPVVAACSGGADSMVLAAATVDECARAGRPSAVVTVDHDLQDGAAARADAVVTWATARGATAALAVRVAVGSRGGPEAAARAARYAALAAAAGDLGADAVLLGHTRDDQAETVLLGLARGSGTRSLAGMPAVRAPYRRPFLTLDRTLVRAAAAAEALPVWDDPHNADVCFRRARLRHSALPALVGALGPGVVAGLVRSAALARDDADALDALAARTHDAVRHADGSLAREALAGEPAAVRRRVLRDLAVLAGVPPGSLTAAHLAAMDALTTGSSRRGPVGLPGGGRLEIRCDRLYLVPPGVPGATAGSGGAG